MNPDCKEDEEEGFIVRVRGLPWSATPEEIVKFFSDCNIPDGENGVHFTFSRDGRPSGEAYIQLSSEEDVANAVAKHNQHMGRRYIEVFRSKQSEMEWVVKRAGPNQMVGGDAVIRLRGLPFGCSKEEIAHFFTGLEIVPNGITLPQDGQGRTTGDAYVQFASPDLAERALEKHKKTIGHRYIEIFKSSLQEAKNAMNMMQRMEMMSRMGGGGGGRMGSGMGRPGPYDRVDRFGGGMGGGMGSGMGSGMGGMGSYGNRGRGRNIKGFFDDDYDDYGNGFGGGGGYGGGNFGGNFRNRRGGGMGGGMGGMSGGMNRGSKGFGGKGGGGFGAGTPGSNFNSQTGHSVHCRGLPFQATEQDILDFFRPLNPVNVVIHFQPNGRATGEADVDFATHEESQEAMKKDKTNMEHRYIELFLNSTPQGRQGGGGGGGNMGMSNMGNNMGMNNMGGGFGDGGMSSYSTSMGSGLGGMNNMGSSMGMGNSMMGNPNYTAF
ncbi:heterogeneous nuclear ribonucleoprotein H3 [Lingula anatina]|uniref:Heterogeneous nuclear ribonucleoprotein H3 n=1 Tax=Lingula anatina TaxID=7574 RepID=A0A1S3JDL2_LINAN|nr:heterogeneous nuclear ribonucleoprotein H3 [Lingula anatina]|eukprot:XP_013408423.1 heterogeneous nuclear ribonucleoprotein H3 [Lingula anatina]